MNGKEPGKTWRLLNCRKIYGTNLAILGLAQKYVRFSLQSSTSVGRNLMRLAFRCSYLARGQKFQPVSMVFSEGKRDLPARECYFRSDDREHDQGRRKYDRRGGLYSRKEPIRLMDVRNTWGWPIYAFFFDNPRGISASEVLKREYFFRNREKMEIMKNNENWDKGKWEIFPPFFYYLHFKKHGLGTSPFFPNCPLFTLYRTRIKRFWNCPETWPSVTKQMHDYHSVSLSWFLESHTQVS